MNEVQFDQAYMFAYSLRDKTHAARNYIDDVRDDIKSKRLQEVINTFRNNIQIRNELNELGRLRLVLVEGLAKKQPIKNITMMSGRSDGNKRILFNTLDNGIPTLYDDNNSISNKNNNGLDILINTLDNNNNNNNTSINKGDYVIVLVTEVRGHTLRGIPLTKSTITNFAKLDLENIEPQLMTNSKPNIIENIINMNKALLNDQKNKITDENKIENVV